MTKETKTDKQGRVAAEWDKFATTVLPHNCGEIQRREMRRAFYAGAQGILFRVINSLAPGGEPTEADLQVMSDIYDELLAFARALKEGRA